MSHARFPTEKAYGRQMAEACSALVRLGHDVTLVVPTVNPNAPADPHAAYGVEPSFPVVRLPHFDPWTTPLVPGFLKTLVGSWFYARALRRYFSSHPADLVYLRSPLLLRAALRTDVAVLLELHTLPGRFRRRFVGLCNRCARVVCLTSPMRDELLSWGVDPGCVMVEGDAVDLRPFASLPSLEEAKVQWRLPTDRPVIGYAGSLVTQDTLEKGVFDLLRACKTMADHGIRIQGWVVGGPQDWVQRAMDLATELGIISLVRFEGPIPAVRVPSALAACDVLVYPAPASRHPYFQRDTSPLKLFEYLAARRPIVCANLPPVRDVMDESVAQLCTPGDPASLAQAVETVLSDSRAAQGRAQKGWDRVQEYTWEKRMGRILSTLTKEP